MIAVLLRISSQIFNSEYLSNSRNDFEISFLIKSITEVRSLLFSMFQVFQTIYFYSDMA